MNNIKDIYVLNNIDTIYQFEDRFHVKIKAEANFSLQFSTDFMVTKLRRQRNIFMVTENLLSDAHEAL